VYQNFNLEENVSHNADINLYKNAQRRLLLCLLFSAITVDGKSFQIFPSYMYTNCRSSQHCHSLCM